MSDVIVLGPLLVRGLAVAVLAGAFAAVWLAGPLATRAGLERAWPRRALELAAVAGVLGARAGNVLGNWVAYEDRPWTALYLWQPGFDPWYGAGFGLAAAFLALRARPLAERGRGLAVMLAGAVGGATVGAALLAALLALSPPGPVTGEPLPALRMQDLEGRPVDTAALAGRVTVLNVWATWCAPCRREMPLLDTVAREWAGRGVVVVGLNLAEPPELVAGFVADAGVHYPIWVDPPSGRPSPSRALFERLGGIGLPTTWFVGPGGRLLDVYTGELSRALLEQRLRELLARRASG